MVLEQLCNLQQPFTEAQLQEACKAERISRATVYNTLNLCIQAKIIRPYERAFRQKVTEYELITAAARSHMQIYCRKCGRRVAIHDKALARMVEERSYVNFIPQHFTLIVYGECKICRRLAAQRTRKAAKDKTTKG